MDIRISCIAAVIGALLPTLTFAAPDLLPDVSQLANGTVGVINQSKEGAGGSLLTIVCQKQGGGSCPESAGMAVYENPAYPNAVTVNVPAIAPGTSFSHALSFWSDLNWTPGTYSLTVLVDVANTVGESNEGNNGTVAQKVVLPASVGSGSPKVGGFAAKKPGQQKAVQPGGGKLVAGLADLMGTTLGFAVNGYTAWGSTTTIDVPNKVKSTKAGPNQNLCIIGTGLYRTFNKGVVAANNFTDIVYRNGTPIYTRQVASLAPKESVDFANYDLPFQEGMNVIQVKMDAGHSVPESNESNTFEVRVIVKVDCNGDGIVAGSTPQIKNPSPATPARQAAPTPLKSR